MERRRGFLSCLGCAGERALRAAFTFSNLVSEEVVEMTYGWTTAKCVDGEPVEWLCLHIHKSEDDAENCLAVREVGRTESDSGTEDRWIGFASDFIKTKNADGAIPDGAGGLLARLSDIDDE